MHSGGGAAPHGLNLTHLQNKQQQLRLSPSALQWAAFTERVYGLLHRYWRISGYNTQERRHWPLWFDTRFPDDADHCRVPLGVGLGVRG